MTSFRSIFINFNLKIRIKFDVFITITYASLYFYLYNLCSNGDFGKMQMIFVITFRKDIQMEMLRCSIVYE